MAKHVLSPDQFFHGTTAALNPGDVIEPTSTSGRNPTFPSDTDPSFAYASSKESNAWSYAEKAWHTTSEGHPRVFNVQPVGEHEEDPTWDAAANRSRGNFRGDRRSRRGWTVVGERPMPEDMGPVEDWR